MAMKWNLETDRSNKTMEELLIEVFGCSSTNERADKMHSDRGKKRIKTEFYLAGNAMETMLIEVFGCSSLEGSAIKIESGKVKKRIKSEPCFENYADNDYAMPLSINA